MERFSIKYLNDSIHIDGFPDAVKVLALTGVKSRRLAHLALHKSDLKLTIEYLETINKIPDESNIAREALWQIAVILYTKCFGNNDSRFSLNSEQIYKGNNDAINCFKYIKALRNKHFVHDENSYSQSTPMAILNKVSSEYKIAKIVCSHMNAETLCNSNYGNLLLLALTAEKWVEAEFDSLCENITTDLESKTYDDLISMVSPTYIVPTVDEIYKKRQE